jgi:hypothetical protein
MGRLILFVIGDSSGNPKDWSEYGKLAFVMAESIEQAKSMVDFSSRGAEVVCGEPTIICEKSPSQHSDF